MDLISTARYGMMAASRTLDASALKIAAANPDGSTDYVQAAIQTVQAKQAFKASAAVLKVSDQLMQALLDIQMAPKR